MSDQIDPELAELRTRIARIVEDAGILGAIKDRFGDLDLTYQEMLQLRDTVQHEWPELATSLRTTIEQSATDTRRAITALQDGGETHAKNLQDVGAAIQSRFDQLEREAADLWSELRAGFANERSTARQHAEVLKTEIETRWSGVQVNFGTLQNSLRERLVVSETALTGRIADAEATAMQTIALAESEHRAQFESLQHVNEQNWSDFRAELLKVQEQLFASHRNLRAELSMQLNDVRGETERRLDTLRNSIDSKMGSLTEATTVNHDALSARLENQIAEHRVLAEQVRAAEIRVQQAYQKSDRLQSFIIVLAVAVALSALVAVLALAGVSM